MAYPRSNRRLHVVLLTASHARARCVEEIFCPYETDIDLACDSDEAAPLIRSHGCDALLVDLDAAGEREVGFVAEVREFSPWLPILSFAGDEKARDQLRPGPGLLHVRDFNALPVRLFEEVQARRESRRNMRLLRCVEDAKRFGFPLGHAPRFQKALRTLDELRSTHQPVLFVGERSTGRRLLARYLHDAGSAHEGARPFVEVDAALDAEALAGAGCVYLPEIMCLGSEALRELVQLAEARDGPRITMATKQVPCQADQSSLAVVLARLAPRRVIVPPLRDRREDIAMLATAFLEAVACDECHQGFSLRALTLLQLWHWPGNLQELAQAVSTAWDLAGGRQIGRRHLIGPGACLPSSLQLRAQSLGGDVDEMIAASRADVLPFESEERRILAHALAAMGGNVTRAAEALEIGRATLYRKIRHFGLRPGSGS